MFILSETELTVDAKLREVAHGRCEKEITVLLNAPRADRVKNITYVKYEVCQLVESASSLLALDIARESKVSALGLKFLGPAQRFTRSRGYRLSSQEVMPSSRREYQILRRYAVFFTLPRPRISHVFEPVSRVASQVLRVPANLSALKNLCKFPRIRISAEGCALRGAKIADYHAACVTVLGENIDFHFHLAPFNTDEQRLPTASGIRHYLARLI